MSGERPTKDSVGYSTVWQLVAGQLLAFQLVLYGPADRISVAAELFELVVSENAAQSFFIGIGLKMTEGTIKKLTEKGFGFIDTETGEDMFFHHSALEGVTYEQLHEGQRVSFTTGQGPKGPRAENVKPI